jgi:hypothetical protein
MMPAIDRRTFLALAAGSGLGIAALPRSPAAMQEEPRKVKGIIWLWMDGGMSQLHTWDPKPILKGGSPFKAIDTSVEGIQISELLPVCAAQMKHLSILRSINHGFADHGQATQLLHTGFSTKPGDQIPLIGTILANELGKKDFPLPSHLVLEAPEIPEPAVFGEDPLPFHLRSLNFPIPNLNGNVGRERDRERAALLLAQNKEWGSRRQQREVAKVEFGYVKSEDLMNTPLLNAFNYHEEPEDLRVAYGGGFGDSCLLARRLIQAGCVFVEIGLKGWGAKPDWCVPYKQLVPTLDRGLGTLVKDLVAKKLLQDTLVVCATAFGKSPPEGTDPWPHGFSLVLAGGALPGGRVYGDTGPDGTGCTLPVPVRDLFATLYKACGVDGQKEYKVELRKRKYAEDGKPVDDLF